MHKIERELLVTRMVVVDMGYLRMRIIQQYVVIKFTNCMGVVHIFLDISFLTVVLNCTE